MNISQVEQLTGITKQNIRFYEKQGLLSPSRNTDNLYRKYSQEDIRTLKIIKMLRKLHMPMEQIKQVLSEQVTLAEAVSLHQKKLQSEKGQLEDAIVVCLELSQESLADLDIDARLSEIANREKSGGIFANIMQDFMAVVRATEKASFGFVPDTMVQNPREFTDALLRYADENKLNLVLTKESMYPEFLIDGVEYTADRRYSRYGAFIRCELAHPERLEPEDVPAPVRSLYRFIWKALFPVAFLLFLFLILSRLPMNNTEIILALMLFGIGLGASAKFFFPRAK